MTLTQLEKHILGGVCVAFGWGFLFVRAPYIALVFMIAAGFLLLWGGKPEHDNDEDNSGGPLRPA
jgi:hypothetical protein